MDERLFSIPNHEFRFFLIGPKQFCCWVFLLLNNLWTNQKISGFRYRNLESMMWWRGHCNYSSVPNRSPCAFILFCLFSPACMSYLGLRICLIVFSKNELPVCLFGTCMLISDKERIKNSTYLNEFIFLNNYVPKSKYLPIWVKNKNKDL